MKTVLAVALLALLANVGFASIAVVAGAVSAALPHRGSLLALLVLPLTTPVLLGASSAAVAFFSQTWRVWGPVLFRLAPLLLIQRPPLFMMMGLLTTLLKAQKPMVAFD